MASVAAPNMATMDVVSTPNRLSTAIITNARMTYQAKLSRNLNSVPSKYLLLLLSAKTAFSTRLAIHMPIIKIEMASSKLVFGSRPVSVNAL